MASDSTPHIRRARAGDRARLLELWQALLDEQEDLEPRFQTADDAAERWRNDYEEWLRDDEHRILLAEVEDEVVGFISACRWFSSPLYRATREVFIEELYVVPGARRQGIGRGLVTSIRTWADEMDIERLRAAVLAQNQAARTFWEALEARSLSVTYTVELGGSATETKEESTRRIGF